MVMAISAGQVERRQDVFGVLLEELIVHPDDNSRVVPHSKEAIAALADSILADGQLQPALCRRVEPGKRLRLIAGFGRYAAVKYINTKLKPEEPLRLQVRVLPDLNEEQGLVVSIKENLDRAETTALDDAHAQKRLRAFGWSEERIAKLYDCSVSYTQQLRKLNLLSAPLQQEVANGNIPVAAAIDLTKIPEEDRPAVVKRARKKKDGAVDPAAVRDAVRQHGGKKARTLAEVRIMLARVADDGKMNEGGRELAQNLTDWIGGVLDDEGIEEGFKEWTTGKGVRK